MMRTESPSSPTFTDLLELARTGIPPGEEDPIDGETADEAYETYLETGVMNPFHARTLRERIDRQSS